MGRLVLGLDIGITSVGYGVIDIDGNSFVDYGVRLFKEGTASNNVDRRSKRGGRRLRRRRQTRLEDMKKYLKEVNIMMENYVPLNNPYEIRQKGLTQKLTSQELTCAILHLTKHRGTTLDTVENDDEGTKSILGRNSKALAMGKYICQIQLEKLENQGKIRGIENNFKTEDYVNEAREILRHQDISEEIRENIIQIISRRRMYYEGPGSEKSPTIYGRWEYFGAEPIDLIEKMRGKCSVFPEELRAPKYSYTAELFNFLNDINNLTIEGEKLSTEDKQKVIEYVHEKGGITPVQLSKQLNVKLEDIQGFRIDKNEKPLLTEFKGYKMFKKIFDKYEFYEYKNNKEVIDEISEIITCKKGIEERKNAIKSKYQNLPMELIDELANMKGITQYHSLSFKAMRLINEEMLVSSMNQMQVLYELKLFDKNRISLKGQKYIYADDEAILSPVAKRAQRETFKVINELRERYGEFDSIVIETTRDKNSQERAQNIRKIQKSYDDANRQVEEILKKEGYDPTLINGKTKQKVRLYVMQECKTAYELKPIDLNLLINDATAYEIDHIIPISISLDDSLNNKVLVTREENQKKGNQTPIYALLNNKFSNVDSQTYRTFVKNNKNYSRKKKENLLYEKDITKFTNIQDFIARNLVDTSYASRVVLNTLTQYFKDNEIQTKVHTIRGSITHLFRKRIHMDKVREQDYLHHAIDALLVASIKKLSLLQTYLVKYDFNELYDEKTGEVFPVKEDNEVLNPIYIQFIQNLKLLHEQSFQYYNGLIKRNEMQFAPIKISHKIDTKPNRQVADETIYSTRCIDNEEKVIKKYKDIYAPNFDKLTNSIINNDNLEKWLMYQNDPQTFKIIQDIILNHFRTYKDDKNVYTYKKGKNQYELKGNNNPLALYFEEHGKIRKYSKKNNGPEITSMKYADGKLNSCIDITKNYDTKNKKVVLLQISPYRTDIYQSPKGKYKIVTIRYNNVFYKKSIKKYVIDANWYQSQKQEKGIEDSWQFICSLHHDELIGIKRKDGSPYVYDLSTEGDGEKRMIKGEYEILKFTATNNDKNNVIEVKPIYTYSKERLKVSVSSLQKVAKFSTDILGNVYENQNNVLKLEFD